MSQRAIVHGVMANTNPPAENPKYYNSHFISKGWNPVGDVGSRGPQTVEEYVEKWADVGDVIIEILGTVVEEEVKATRDFRRGDRHGSHYVVAANNGVVVWKIDGGVSPNNHIVTDQQGRCLTAAYRLKVPRPTTAIAKKKVLKKVNV